MIQFNRLFGVHDSLKQEMKLWGPVFLTDAIIFFLTLAVFNMGAQFFTSCPSPIPHIIFGTCTVGLGFYSALRPAGNAGKRNYEMFALSFNGTIRFFRSINVADYQPLTMVFNLHSNKAVRLLVDRTYRERIDGKE